MKELFQYQQPEIRTPPAELVAAADLAVAQEEKLAGKDVGPPQCVVSSGNEGTRIPIILGEESIEDESPPEEERMELDTVVLRRTV